MATQAYLDAVVNGSFTTPTGWTTLADTWEASAFSDEDSKLWVDVKIEDPATATLLIARSVTTTDLELVTSFLDPTSLPALEIIIAAVGILKSLSTAGRELPGHLEIQVIDDFNTYITDRGVSLTLGVAP